MAGAPAERIPARRPCFEAAVSLALAWLGLACTTALVVATRRAGLGEINLRLSTYWYARSGFGRTGMLPGGFIHAMAMFDDMKDRPFNVGLSDANLSKVSVSGPNPFTIDN